VGLHLAERLIGPDILDLPEPVRTAILRDRAIRPLTDWYEHHLLHDPDSDWHRGSPALLWRALRMRDSPSARIRTAWQLLFEPTRTDWAPLGDGEAGGEGSAAGAWRRITRLLRRHRRNS
jgi:hypothetical protein